VYYSSLSILTLFFTLSLSTCMHQAKGTDYLSRVAWLAGIPLDKFMLDNTEAVRDLDAALAGVNLLLCGRECVEGCCVGRGLVWGGVADCREHCVTLTMSMQCFEWQHIYMQCFVV
jgi:hypothetical protein